MKLKEMKKFFLLILFVLTISFGLTTLIQSAKAVVCYDGKVCTDYSNCHFSSGYWCLNAGGLQTTGCQNDDGTWMPGAGLPQCGAKLTWSLPWICLTNTASTCGGQQAVVCF